MFQWERVCSPAKHRTPIWSSRRCRTASSYTRHAPGCETQEARLSLFTKGSYTKLKNALVRALLGADFYITDRRYIGFETETGFHHYAIDVAQIYELEV